MDLPQVHLAELKKPTGQKNTPDFFGGIACSEIEIIYGLKEVVTYDKDDI